MKNNKKYIYTISITLVSKLQHCNKLGLLRCILFKGFHTSRRLYTIPVKVYENADTQKAEIRKENKGKSGIYSWKNLQNGKIYVGSTVDICRRITSYFNLAHISREPSYIHSALLKWGYSNFSFTVLEYCSKEDLIQREQYYIDTLNPDYNLCLTAGSTLGKLHSEIAKAKISVTKKGTFSGEDNHFHGKIHTEDARKKMSVAKLGIKLTQELKDKLSLASPKSRQIAVLDLETNIETVYHSIAEAAKILALPKSSLHASIGGKTPYRKRYVARYVSDDK